MKNLTVLYALLLFAVCGVTAQVTTGTYEYRYMESVHPRTEVRSKYNRDNFYLTFTRSNCYQSNAQGHKTGNIYEYKGKEDNIHIYFYESRVPSVL